MWINRATLLWMKRLVTEAAWVGQRKQLVLQYYEFKNSHVTDACLSKTHTHMRMRLHMLNVEPREWHYCAVKFHVVHMSAKAWVAVGRQSNPPSKCVLIVIGCSVCNAPKAKERRCTETKPLLAASASFILAQNVRVVFACFGRVPLPYSSVSFFFRLSGGACLLGFVLFLAVTLLVILTIASNARLWVFSVNFLTFSTEYQ